MTLRQRFVVDAILRRQSKADSSNDDNRCVTCGDELFSRRTRENDEQIICHALQDRFPFHAAHVQRHQRQQLQQQQHLVAD
jgi:hypothetical protein